MSEVVQSGGHKYKTAANNSTRKFGKFSTREQLGEFTARLTFKFSAGVVDCK